MTEPRDSHIKAYHDRAFVDSRSGRPLRLLAEYLEPESRFAHYEIKDTIVFFGSARIPSGETAQAELAEAEAGRGDLDKARSRLGMSRYYEDTRALAARLTDWSKNLKTGGRRFVVCTGGGPGIMEAANRGASEARGLNIGLTISLPVEEFDNPYVTRQLAFEFHYFFMRKFWFAYLAKAVVVMPGGFGTLDELFEMMTLIQTLKIKKKLPVVLFGTDYWDEVVNFDALMRHGTIDAQDLDLFFRTNSIDTAYEFITGELAAHALDSPDTSL